MQTVDHLIKGYRKQANRVVYFMNCLNNILPTCAAITLNTMSLVSMPFKAIQIIYYKLIKILHLITPLR